MIKEWTTTELKAVINAYMQDGISAAVEVSGRSKLATLRQLARQGVKNGRKKGPERKYYAEDIAAIMEFNNMGLSLEALAVGYRTTARKLSYVLCRARKYGFERYPKREVTL